MSARSRLRKPAAGAPCEVAKEQRPARSGAAHCPWLRRRRRQGRQRRGGVFWRGVRAKGARRRGRAQEKKEPGAIDRRLGGSADARAQSLMISA